MTNKEIAKLIRDLDDKISSEFGCSGPDPLIEEALAALESEPLAKIVAQYGKDAKGRHYLVFDQNVIRPNIYEYHGDPPMFPVTVTVTKR